MLEKQYCAISVERKFYNDHYRIYEVFKFALTIKNNEIWYVFALKLHFY
jgi:hypothetical protein